jgi:hypothetical protein
MTEELQLATDPPSKCERCTHYYHFHGVCGLKVRADAGLTPPFACQYEKEQPFETQVDLWLAQLRFNFLEELRNGTRRN